MSNTENRHLNMFYPYRREVIEQNLTRALIIVLRILNSEARNTLLKVIVGDVCPSSLTDEEQLVYTIEDATAPPKNCKFKRLVAISTTGVIKEDSDTDAKSIPDAQIRVGSGNDAVIMIESKVRSNTLSLDQLKRHAVILGEDLDSVIHVVTWNKISSEVSKLILSGILSDTEAFVAQEFLNFLSMNYGYGILNRLLIPSFRGLEIPSMG
jgi:hypothetical protein